MTEWDKPRENELARSLLDKQNIIPCGKKFLRVLIFAIFPAICKNKFPQIKITANMFPAKIYSRVNILWLKFTTQKYSTKKSCLFNHNSSLHSETTKYWFIAWKYVFLLHVFNKKPKYYQCWVGTGYFLKIAKINSQQEKPISPNHKN